MNYKKMEKENTSKIIEVAYSMSIKKQISQFEPIEVFFSMKAEAGDDWKEALKEIRSNVRKVMKSEETTLETYKKIMSKPLRSSSAREMDEAERSFAESLEKI